jgi:hypothetical protein
MCFGVIGSLARSTRFTITLIDSWLSGPPQNTILTAIRIPSYFNNHVSFLLRYLFFAFCQSPKTKTPITPATITHVNATFPLAETTLAGPVPRVLPPLLAEEDPDVAVAPAIDEMGTGSVELFSEVAVAGSVNE